VLHLISKIHFNLLSIKFVSPLFKCHPTYSSVSLRLTSFMTYKAKVKMYKEN